MLQNGAQHVRHEALYKFLLEEELFLSGIKTVNYLDKALFEAIILHKLFGAEEPGRGDHTVRRSLVVIGSMIQSRLTRLLMELNKEGAQALLEMPAYASGLDRDAWTTAVVGASATAKAAYEFMRVEEFSVYMASTVDDVQYGIDLFVEIEWAGTGACVSVKGRASQPDCFFLTPPSFDDNRPDWDRISQGTSRFNEIFHRAWHPALLQLERKKSGMVDQWRRKEELREAMMLALTEGEFVSVFAPPSP
jgi:hypothetical protein